MSKEFPIKNKYKNIMVAFNLDWLLSILNDSKCPSCEIEKECAKQLNIPKKDLYGFLFHGG